MSMTSPGTTAGHAGSVAARRSPGRLLQLDDGRPAALPERPDGDDRRPRHGPAPSGRATSAGGSGGGATQDAERDQDGAGGDAPPVARPGRRSSERGRDQPAARRPVRPPRAATAGRERAAPPPIEERRGDRRRAASRPLPGTRQRTVTRSRSASKVFWPSELPRPQVVDGRERLGRSGVDDLGRRHRADPGERLELRLRRPVEVDEAVVAGCRPPAADPVTGAGRARVVPRRHDDLGAVLEDRGEVQLARRPSRIDARAVATGGPDGIADPRAAGQAVDARRRDGAGHVHDDLAGRLALPACPDDHAAGRVAAGRGRRQRPSRSPRPRRQDGDRHDGRQERRPRRRRWRRGAVAPDRSDGAEGASTTRHGALDGSTGPRPAGLQAGVTNVPSVGALRRTGRVRSLRRLA